MSQDANGIVSVEQNGRVLSGVGVESADLEQVMERHAPPEPKTPAAPTTTATPVAEPVTAPAAPESKGRKRFSELTNERKAAEERAATAERERDELKARLAQPPPAQTPAAPVQQQQSLEPQPQWQATRSKPTEDDIGTAYQTYADFVEDLSDWKAEQRIAASNIDGRIRQTLDLERSARSYEAQVKATHEKGRVAYADFDTVYQSGPGGQVQMPLDRLHAIYQAPNSEHLQYAVMKDAALAQRLATVSPIEFGMELARLSGTHQPSTGTGAAVTQQPAPAPYQPVGTGSKTTSTTSGELASGGYDFDRSGYREKRAAERAALRGRK